MHQEEPGTGSYLIHLHPILLEVPTDQVLDDPKLQVSDVSFSFAAGVAIGRAWAGAPAAPIAQWSAHWLEVSSLLRIGNHPHGLKKTAFSKLEVDT